LAFTLTCVVASSSIGRAALPDDNLAAVRAAYIATEYEEALKLLSVPGDRSLADQFDVYRALCLLALGRMDEVDRVLRSIATRNPSFRMSETDVTPRMIALYDDIRRTAVTGMARDAYTGRRRISMPAGSPRHRPASGRCSLCSALAMGPTEKVRRPAICASSRGASKISLTAKSPAPGEAPRRRPQPRRCLPLRRPEQ
jgi:hypothetical protein